MQRLASGIGYIDLTFQGLPRVIATAVLHGPDGVVLVDPGPSTSLPTLDRELAGAGFARSDVAAIFLTHIHLDHAGAVGTMVAAQPDLKIYVHEIGAPHLVDPAKLLASATRLYGDAMEQLWGEVRPVPRGALVSLTGGERIKAGGRMWDVAYTPGHASHHVSYFDPDSGVAFVGDAAGVKLVPNGVVMPPTPPPDVDLEAWRRSLTAIGAWNPATLFLTHFGPSGPVAPHLAELEAQLTRVADLAQASLARDEDDHEREAWFSEEIRRDLRRRLDGSDLAAYAMAGRFDLNWKGLARYFRKRDSGGGSRGSG